MERPEVDVISLSLPSAIEFKTTTLSPRSTVGAINEIYDYPRVITAPSASRTAHLAATPHAPVQRSISCKPFSMATLQARRSHHDPRAHRARRKGAYRLILKISRKMATSALRIDGELYPLMPRLVLDKRQRITPSSCLDRLLVSTASPRASRHPPATALKLASGLEPSPSSERDMSFPKSSPARLRHFRPRNSSRSRFSFNSPYCACPACTGLGSKYDFESRTRPLSIGTRPPIRPGPRPGFAAPRCSKRTIEIAPTPCFDLSILLKGSPRAVSDPDSSTAGLPPMAASHPDRLPTPKVKNPCRKRFPLPRHPEIPRPYFRNPLRSSGVDDPILSARFCSVCHGKRLPAESLAGDAR